MRQVNLGINHDSPRYIRQVVSVLCSFAQAPTKYHYSCGLRVIGYLVRTKLMGITYGGSLRIPIGLSNEPEHFASSYGLHLYSDASFGSRPKPLAGYVVMLCNGAIFWTANYLKIVPFSTHESEQAIAALAAKDFGICASTTTSYWSSCSRPHIPLDGQQSFS